MSVVATITISDADATKMKSELGLSNDADLQDYVETQGTAQIVQPVLDRSALVLEQEITDAFAHEAARFHLLNPTQKTAALDAFDDALTTIEGA